LACGKLGFVRLTRRGFDSFATHEARRIARIPIEQPLNAVALSGDSTLIVGKKQVARYYRGQKDAPRFARIPLLGPLQAWADPQNIDGFWVRYLRDPDLHYYTLVDAERSVTFGETRSLEEFDRRFFTLLADGSPFYTTRQGLVRSRLDGVRHSPQPKLEGALAGLWPGGRIDRYWVASDAGELRLLELSRGEPLIESLQVPGVPFSMDVDNDRLAVISVEPRGPDSQWQLSVFRGAERVANLELPSDVGSASLAQQSPATTARSQATNDLDNRDVCLVRERPWVVAGGKDLVQLFDYDAQQVLQTWSD
jgi:hypothetical protein